jgi:hypothetical protein
MSNRVRGHARSAHTITDNLDLATSGELGPRLPVVLVEGVLDGNDGVLGDQVVVVLTELFTSQPLGGVRVGVLRAGNQQKSPTLQMETHLEVEIVLAVLVEFGRSDVQSDGDLALVTGGLDGFNQKLERVLGTLDGRSETTLVSDSGVGQTVLLLDDTLQGVVDLGTHLHGLGEAGSSGGQDHEFLEGETVTSVGTTVDDVERRGGEDVGGLDTGEFGQVLVERDTLDRRNEFFRQFRFQTSASRDSPFQRHQPRKQPWRHREWRWLRACPC